MNLGEQIVNRIIESKLFHAEPVEGGAPIVIWSSGAPEQLEAIFCDLMGRQREDGK
jgi:hypothetical protein